VAALIAGGKSMRVITIASLAAIAALAGCANKPPLPAAPADLVAAVNARGANECNGTVAKVLNDHGVTAPQLVSLRYTQTFAVRSHGGFVNGQTAWVYLQGQTGVGLIHLDDSCESLGIGGDGGFRYPR